MTSEAQLKADEEAEAALESVDQIEGVLRRPSQIGNQGNKHRDMIENDYCHVFFVKLTRLLIDSRDVSPATNPHRQGRTEDAGKDERGGRRRRVRGGR